MVREITCDKVLGALKASEVALSANAIQEATGTNYASVMACLDLLVKQGKVKAVGTSNGVFYSLIYKGFDGGRDRG